MEVLIWFVVHVSHVQHVPSSGWNMHRLYRMNINTTSDFSLLSQGEVRFELLYVKRKNVWTEYISCVFSGSEELGSGSYGHRYITETVTGDDDGFDVDDSDYDIYIEEVNFKTPVWHFCFLFSLFKCLVLSDRYYMLRYYNVIASFSSVRMNLLLLICGRESIQFISM